MDAHTGKMADFYKGTSVHSPPPGQHGRIASMAFNPLTYIFGTRNDRLLKTYRKTLERINALEIPLESLSDEALKAKTEEFKQRHQQGESLDDLLPEAFAVVREGSKRIMKMRHFDLQMLGGIALHQGKSA